MLNFKSIANVFTGKTTESKVNEDSKILSPRDIPQETDV